MATVDYGQCQCCGRGQAHSGIGQEKQCPPSEGGRPVYLWYVWLFLGRARVPVAACVCPVCLPHIGAEVAVAFERCGGLQ